MSSVTEKKIFKVFNTFYLNININTLPSLHLFDQKTAVKTAILWIIKYNLKELFSSFIFYQIYSCDGIAEFSADLVVKNMLIFLWKCIFCKTIFFF